MSEAALQQSVSLLEATLEATAEGLLIVDLDGRIVRVNKQFAEKGCLIGRHWRVALALITTLACAAAEDATTEDTGRAEAEVRLRLASYATAAAAVDAATSARFFGPRGTLFEPGIPPIVSPDSIRAFIASFPGVEVDSAMLRADTVEVFGRTALVWGTYFERLRFPGQPESAQHGRFVMEWRRDAEGVWLIERYYRVPLPAGWRDGR